MRRRAVWIIVGLCFWPAACVPVEESPLLVSNPFGQSPQPQQSQSSYSPASKEVAVRVACVGDRIVKANTEIGLHPLFFTIAAPLPEIFHRGQKEIFITEGLVGQCANEGQLAAVLCGELGKMAAEREALALPTSRDSERGLPQDVPVGNDAADGIHRFEMAKYERERTPRNLTIPPPSPTLLSRRYLQKAGYQLEDFDAAAPLLRQSEANNAWRKQLLTNP